MSASKAYSDELLLAVAQAVQKLNLDGNDARVPFAPGKYVLLQSAENSDGPAWCEGEDPEEIFDPEDLEDLTPFQRANGGGAGLCFSTVDDNEDELPDSNGGQWDGYLSNLSAEMPATLAAQAAADVLDELFPS